MQLFCLLSSLVGQYPSHTPLPPPNYTPARMYVSYLKLSSFVKRLCHLRSPSSLPSSLVDPATDLVRDFSLAASITTATLPTLLRQSRSSWLISRGRAARSLGATNRCTALCRFGGAPQSSGLKSTTCGTHPTCRSWICLRQ